LSSTGYTITHQQPKDLQNDIEPISNDIGDLATPDPGKMGKNPKSKQTKRFQSSALLICNQKLSKF
jgi:hypothetical protein